MIWSPSDFGRAEIDLFQDFRFFWFETCGADSAFSLPIPPLERRMCCQRRSPGVFGSFPFEEMEELPFLPESDRNCGCPRSS